LQSSYLTPKRQKSSESIFKTILAVTASLTSAAASTAPLTDDQIAFRELYRELVEINTTLSAGSCTDAVYAMVFLVEIALGFADWGAGPKYCGIDGISSRPS
jgi:hypothetical protein